VDDQSGLVRALDEVGRDAKDAFLRVGLEDYRRILPEPVRLGAGRPCFEITIRREDEDVTAADDVTADGRRATTATALWRGGTPRQK